MQKKYCEKCKWYGLCGKYIKTYCENKKVESYSQKNKCKYRSKNNANYL